jgi:hypothetical protein
MSPRVDTCHESNGTFVATMLVYIRADAATCFHGKVPRVLYGPSRDIAENMLGEKTLSCDRNDGAIIGLTRLTHRSATRGPPDKD